MRPFLVLAWHNFADIVWAEGPEDAQTVFTTEHPRRMVLWCYEFVSDPGTSMWHADLDGTHITLGPLMRERVQAVMR